MVICADGYASFSARTVGVAKITSPMKAKSMTKIRSTATLPPPPLHRFIITYPIA